MTVDHEAKLSSFPQPIISKPSPYWITDLFRSGGLASRSMLKRQNVAELGELVPRNIQTIKPSDLAAARGMSHGELLMLTKRARDAQIYTLWERHRETYFTHPEMSLNLMNMKSSVEIPAGVFRRLRHSDPLFLIPGAIPIVHGDGLPGRIIGIHVAGGFSPRFPCAAQSMPPGLAESDVRLASTHADGINCYSVSVLSEVHSPDGATIQDFDVLRLTVPLAGKFSVDSLIDDISSRGFLWSENMGSELTAERKRAYLQAAARAAVSHLLYATSRTVDLEDRAHNDRPSAPRKAGEPKGIRPARVRKLGFQMGATIEDFKRRPARNRVDSVPTGKSVRPHTRAAHLHMYLVGVGRQETDFQWLDPIDVNSHANDGKTVTMHPMGRPAKKQ